MPKSRDEKNQNERLLSAAENLKKILEELAPFEKPIKIKEMSTAGTWRASPDASVGVSTIHIERAA